jgi:DNA mismatch repair ATPase MutS
MLSAGQSYFFAELDRIQEFTELSHGSGLRLFLIDEPFRGTNTVERIAISSAVLRYLANRHLVLASTHDAELQMLLADAFDMFHFSDRVVNDSYGFDYLIRPGPAKTKNAIRLLEIRGYPASVISESERTAASLASKAQPHNGDSAAVEGQP